MKRRLPAWAKVLLVLAALGVFLGIPGALGFIYFGVYNIAATEQHTQPVLWLLATAMKHSVRQRAARLVVPVLSDAGMVERGFCNYRAKCLQCHGAPGVGMDDVGRGMTPAPNNLVQTGREWTPAMIFWVTKHGAKMTGMPSWKYKFTDDELWDITAFVHRMPRLPPADYAAMDRELSPEECRDLGAKRME